jgi:uncharacterized protein (TIGR00369 family)
MPDDGAGESDEEAARRREQVAQWNRNFAAHVPHNRALGLEIVDLGEGWSSYRLPWAPRIVGNPETGVVHGGAITALLDAACGSAVFSSLPKPMPVATLDLRIDYLKPATRERDVHARARCVKMTRNVAFVRAVAYHDDEEDPIATATGTFMLSTRSGSGPSVLRAPAKEEP